MAVSSALANIALGLITSVVGGAAVWLWQHLAVRRSRRAKESFFGLARGTGCLIIFNNAAGRRGAMHHNDVQAMIEVATLAASTGSPVSVESCNDFQGLNGNRTEFRSAARVAAQPAHRRAPDRPAAGPAHARGGYPAADLRNRRPRDLRSPGSEEFALVAKFTPDGSSRPVTSSAARPRCPTGPLLSISSASTGPSPGRCRTCAGSPSFRGSRPATPSATRPRNWPQTSPGPPSA